MSRAVGRVRVEDVAHAVARVPSRVGAGIGGPLSGARRRRAAARAPRRHGGRHSRARREVDDRDPSPSGLPAAFPARRGARRPARRSRRELLVRRLAGMPRRPRPRCHQAAPPPSLAGSPRARSRTVRMSACGPQAKDGAVEAGLAKRVLAAPPSVDLVHVRRHPRRRISAARVGSVCRDTRRATGPSARCSARRPVLRRRRPAPRRGARRPRRRRREPRPKRREARSAATGTLVLNPKH